MEMKVPVFFVTGFLEAGKTNFLLDTVFAEYFQTEDNTVLFLTEEGIEEYDEDELKEFNTYLVTVDSQEEFTPEFMLGQAAKYNAARVIIEWNGMWNPADLKLPAAWDIYQHLMIINAETFENYYQNGDMRSILARLALGAEVMICNRCNDETMDLQKIKKELKGINSAAEIVMEGDGGEYDLPFDDDELPYDISQEIVEIAPEHYGVFFMDSGERTDRYDGLTVRYTAMVNKPRGMKKDEMVIGRVALNGCVDPNCVDTNCEKVLLGYLAKFKNAYSLKNGEWLRVTATVKKQFVAEYGNEGPVLYVKSVEPAEPLGYVTFG